MPKLKTHCSAQNANIKNKRNILFLQYGDFGNDWERLSSGGEEFYFEQKNSVNHAISFCSINTNVTVVSLGAKRTEDRVLSCGIRVISVLSTDPAYGLRSLLFWRKMLNFINPTDIILRTPLVSVGIIARLKNIRTLPCFADTIKSTGVRTTVLRQLWRLAFNGRHVQIISNHHITACKNLADIGFPSEKIVPWDWPNRVHPAQRSPKRLTMKKDGAHSLIYVGAVSRAKGVHDLLDALPHVAEAGLNVRLSIIGRVTKEIEADLQQYIRSIGIEKQVLIIGAVANSEIINRMHLADLVIIPSRYEYPEGMPITIKEALCSRTPTIISDHPVFSVLMKNGEGVMSFAAGQSTELAEKICKVLTDATLYEHLSCSSVKAFDRMQIPVDWYLLINRWLANTQNDIDALRVHNLDCVSQ